VGLSIADWVLVVVAVLDLVLDGVIDDAGIDAELG
jgi:hypothetical protein